MLLSICFLLPQVASACTCAYDGGPFIEFSNSQTVVAGTVVEVANDFPGREIEHPKIKVVIDDVIMGEFEPAHVELLGDRGWDCLEAIDIERFAAGSQHLFVLFDKDPV